MLTLRKAQPSEQRMLSFGGEGAKLLSCRGREGGGGLYATHTLRLLTVLVLCFKFEQSKMLKCRVERARVCACAWAAVRGARGSGGSGGFGRVWERLSAFRLAPRTACSRLGPKRNGEYNRRCLGPVLHRSSPPRLGLFRKLVALESGAAVTGWEV